MTGACLVIGCHPCWRQDYEAASAVYPDHKICAVNFAVELVKADYLATCHASFIKAFLLLHEVTHGGSPLIVYAKPVEHTDVKDVNYLDLPTHGGSGVYAAAAMASIFDNVVMCGCPIDGNGGYAQKNYVYDDWNVGGEHKRIVKWYNGMCEFAHDNPDVAKKIRSMSGNTKKIFGGLDGN